jgi:hypothetical protein
LRSRPLGGSSIAIYGPYPVLRDLTVMAVSPGQVIRVVEFHHANKQYKGQEFAKQRPLFAKSSQKHS